MTSNLDNYPDFLTPDEFAEYMRVEVGDIFSSLKQGEIPGIKIGGHWRIPKTYISKILGIKPPQNFEKLKRSPSARNSEKLQDLVKKEMTILLSNNQTENNLILDLQKKEYCKKNFDINFPVLLKYDHNKSIKEQGIDLKGYRRYWTHIFPGDFLVCSQWYQRQRPLFEKWLEAHKK